MPRRGATTIAAERRLKAFELRKAGASYREIGAELGTSQVQALRDVRKVLDTMAKMAEDDIKRLRILEDQRLDALLRVWWPRAVGIERKRPNMAVFDRVLKLMERRAKLLGLDAPSQVEMAGPGGEPLIPISSVVVHEAEPAQSEADGE